MTLRGRRLLATLTVIIAVTVTDLLGLAPLLAQPPATPLPPTPPRSFIDTSPASPGGRRIAVAAGGNLQAALTAARPGDVIELEPGAVFRGNFSLPKKSGDGWILVRPAVPVEKLPAPGTRVSPASGSVMPKIVSPNSNPALSTESGAHHFRFIALEFTVAADVKTINSIVAFGAVETTAADIPHSLILDRCYVHGHAQLRSRRGVLLNSGAAAVIDSHISEIHDIGADSQAILGYNGPGPFRIVNSFLEAAGENIMFGGADPRIVGLVPSDIEIRGNHLFKPMRWRPGDSAFAGVSWTIKNLLEFKNAQRVVVEGNLLENMWGGAAVVLTPRNQEGSAPWSVVQDILIRNNIVKNVTSGFVVQTTDDLRPSQPTKRIAITNNLWLGVARTFFGMTGGGGGTLHDLLIDHNTAVPVGFSTYYAEAPAAPAIVRLQLTNNLLGFGAYGVPVYKADGGRAAWFPGSVIARNALVNIADVGDGQGVKRNVPQVIDQSMYASFPTAAAAGINAEGGLTAESPNRRAGTDGKDIGVDFDQLRRARGRDGGS